MSKEEAETGIREYDFVSGYFEGRASVRRGLWGFIDEAGNEIIPCIYLSVRNFVDGMAIAQNESEKWGCIDVNGKEVIPFKYDRINDFLDGETLVAYVFSQPFSSGDHYGFGAYETEGYGYHIHYRFINKDGNETFAHDEYKEDTSFTAGAKTYTLNMPDNKTAKIKWGIKS